MVRRRKYVRTGIRAADQAEYMREYRKLKPNYEMGGLKREPMPETPRPTVGPKYNPDYARDYCRWRRQEQRRREEAGDEQ